MLNTLNILYCTVLCITHYTVPVPLGQAATHSHPGDQDRRDKAGDLGHGVGDPEQDPGVGPRHLGVREVEAPGDGELVE